MDTWICMAGSLCCLPETITTLLFGHTPIQSKELKKKRSQVGQSYLLCPLGRVKTELLAELKLPLQPHLIYAFSGRFEAVSQVSVKTDFYSFFPPS